LHTTFFLFDTDIVDSSDSQIIRCSRSPVTRGKEIQMNLLKGIICLWT